MCFVGPREVLSPYLYPNFLPTSPSLKPFVFKSQSSRKNQFSISSTRFQNFKIFQLIPVPFLIISSCPGNASWSFHMTKLPEIPARASVPNAPPQSCTSKRLSELSWPTLAYNVHLVQSPTPFFVGKKEGQNRVFSQTIYRKHHKWWVSCQMGSLKNNKFANSIHGVFVARWCVWRGNWSLKWTKHWSLVFLNLQLLISP